MSFLFGRKSKTTPVLTISSPALPLVEAPKVVTINPDPPVIIEPTLILPDPILEPVVPESVEHLYTSEETVRNQVWNNITNYINSLEDIVDGAIQALNGKCCSNTIINLNSLPIGNSIVRKMIKVKVDEINGKVCKYIHLTFDEIKATCIILNTDLDQIVTDSTISGTN